MTLASVGVGDFDQGQPVSMIRSGTHALRTFRLAANILPLAPDRFLFATFSDDALSIAAETTARYPEKRGTLSHAVRSLFGTEKEVDKTQFVVIEAHIDGRDIAPELCNELLKLGFEPDGFAKYNPEHFNSHLTLKFSTQLNNPSRRAELLSLIRSRCDAAFALLNGKGNIEAYIELEVYPYSRRRSWSNTTPSARWHETFPVGEGSLQLAIPTCDPEIPPVDRMQKRADIHIKIGREVGSIEVRQKILDHLHQRGFYHVVTWASNDICTAEFLHMRDALTVFNTLSDFFERNGGAVEMTLESVAAIWRTSYSVRGAKLLATLPPLVTSLNRERI